MQNLEILVLRVTRSVCHGAGCLQSMIVHDPLRGLAVCSCGSVTKRDRLCGQVGYLLRKDRANVFFKNNNKTSD